MKTSKLLKVVEDLRLNDSNKTFVTAFQKIYLDVLEDKIEKWIETYEKSEIDLFDINKIIQDTRKEFLNSWTILDNIIKGGG